MSLRCGLCRFTALWTVPFYCVVSLWTVPFYCVVDCSHLIVSLWTVPFYCVVDCVGLRLSLGYRASRCFWACVVVHSDKQPLTLRLAVVVTALSWATLLVSYAVMVTLGLKDSYNLSFKTAGCFVHAAPVIIFMFAHRSKGKPRPPPPPCVCCEGLAPGCIATLYAAELYFHVVVGRVGLCARLRGPR